MHVSVELKADFSRVCRLEDRPAYFSRPTLTLSSFAGPEPLERLRTPALVASAFGGNAVGGDVLLRDRSSTDEYRARYIGRFERKHKEAARVLEGIARHDDIPSRITIELTEGGYVSLGSDDEVELNKAVKVIRGVLPHNPNEAMTENDILDAVATQDVSKRTAQRARKWLMERGENPIKREGEGKKNDPYRYWHPCPGRVAGLKQVCRISF